MRTPPPFTAEHNDTLGGLLYAHEREEEKHLRRCLGYWRMVEERMIRDQLAAEGWHEANPGAWIGFEISRRVEANHRNDPTLREMQAARPIAVVRSAQAEQRFTVEEMERLSQHFAGANDPVAQSILAKALASLAGAT